MSFDLHTMVSGLFGHSAGKQINRELYLHEKVPS